MNIQHWCTYQTIQDFWLNNKSQSIFIYDFKLYANYKFFDGSTLPAIK